MIYLGISLVIIGIFLIAFGLFLYQVENYEWNSGICKYCGTTWIKDKDTKIERQYHCTGCNPQNIVLVTYKNIDRTTG